jgi:hypothetical protein
LSDPGGILGAMNEIERFCDACGDARVFVTPPCEDGHGLDCTDLCCTDCGAALTGATWGLVEEVVLVHAA